MPGNEKIMAAIEKAKGKKAKIKPIKMEISGAKPKGMPKEVQQALEEVFGAKLSKVRLHTGGNLREVGSNIGAYVFAVGNDIYFRNAKDASDKQLLAHEVAHMVQAAGGKGMPKEKSGKVYASS